MIGFRFKHLSFQGKHSKNALWSHFCFYCWLWVGILPLGIFDLKHVSISGKDLPDALYIPHTSYTLPNHTKYYHCMFRRKISIDIPTFLKSFEMMTTKKSRLIFKALSYGNRNISSISSLSILLLTINTFPYSGHTEPFAKIVGNFWRATVLAKTFHSRCLTRSYAYVLLVFRWIQNCTF